MYSGYRGISCVVGRTLSIISALGSGHNQTTIEPITKNKDVTREPLQLGHFDDQHYVSLRKKNWSDVWFESKKFTHLPVIITHATSCGGYYVFDPSVSQSVSQSVSPVFLVSATHLKQLNRIS